MTTTNETEVPVKQVIVRDNTVPPEVGRDVLYILSEADSPTSAGQCRPAKIVALVDDGSEHGLVNLQIFTNGGFDQLPNVHHAKNVLHDECEEKKRGTWHWPPPRTLVFQARDVPIDELEEEDEEEDEELEEGEARTAAHAEEKGYPIGLPPNGFEKGEEIIPPPAETSEGLPFGEDK